MIFTRTVCQLVQSVINKFINCLCVLMRMKNENEMNENGEKKQKKNENENLKNSNFSEEISGEYLLLYYRIYSCGVVASVRLGAGRPRFKFPLCHGD